MFAAGKTKGAVAGASTDPYFKNVTMLLHGDGTNGGQNNTFLDSSTNNFTITRNGNTTQGTFSPYGTLWSNYFNGANVDYLTVASNAAFGFGTGDFTCEGWFNSSVTSGAGGIFNITPGSLSGTALLLRQDLGGYQIFLNGSYAVATATIPVNQWTHFAIVRSSGVFKFYINGVQLYSASDTTNYASGPVAIGYAFTTTYAYTGYLSNLRIVKGTALYTSNFTPSTTPLTAVSGTSLLTCQSNRFIDNSSNNFTLTANGSPSVQRFSPFAPSAAYSTATIGGSGYFDGSGDYLTLANNSAWNVGSNDFTLQGWLYYSGDLAYLWYPGTSSTYVNIGVVVNSTSIVAYMSTAGSTWNYAASNTVQLNAWNHFALVRNGSTVTLYINGVGGTSATVGSDVLYNSGQTLGIGAANDGHAPLKGYLSDYSFVNGTALYTTNFTPPTSPTSPSGKNLSIGFTNGAIFDNAMMNDLETVGNAQISTSVKKYGTGSLAFNGTTDYLTTPTSSVLQLGAGDFTIEWWAYPTASVGGQEMIALSSFDDNYPPLFGYQSGSTWQVYLSSTGSSWDISSGNSLGALAINTWTHYAITRSGSTFRAFENGVQQSTWTSSANIAQAANKMTVGNGQATHFFKGYIDDLRITKGYARYTANFTPPTAAFPNN